MTFAVALTSGSAALADEIRTTPVPHKEHSERSEGGRLTDIYHSGPFTVLEFENRINLYSEMATQIQADGSLVDQNSGDYVGMYDSEGIPKEPEYFLLQRGDNILKFKILFDRLPKGWTKVKMVDGYPSFKAGYDTYRKLEPTFYDIDVSNLQDRDPGWQWIKNPQVNNPRTLTLTKVARKGTRVLLFFTFYDEKAATNVEVSLKADSYLTFKNGSSGNVNKVLPKSIHGIGISPKYTVGHQQTPLFFWVEYEVPENVTKADWTEPESTWHIESIPLPVTRDDIPATGFTPTREKKPENDSGKTGPEDPTGKTGPEDPTGKTGPEDLTGKTGPENTSGNTGPENPPVDQSGPKKLLEEAAKLKNPTDDQWRLLVEAALRKQGTFSTLIKDVHYTNEPQGNINDKFRVTDLVLSMAEYNAMAKHGLSFEVLENYQFANAKEYTAARKNSSSPKTSKYPVRITGFSDNLMRDCVGETTVRGSKAYKFKATEIRLKSIEGFEDTTIEGKKHRIYHVKATEVPTNYGLAYNEAIFEANGIGKYQPKEKPVDGIIVLFFNPIAGQWGIAGYGELDKNNQLDVAGEITGPLF